MSKLNVNVECQGRMQMLNINVNVECQCRTPMLHANGGMADISTPSQDDGSRQPQGNFSNRPHPPAQNHGAVPMGIVLWRVAEKRLSAERMFVFCSCSGSG